MLRRGTAYAFQNVFDKALVDFQEVLKLEPNNKAALVEISRMRAMAAVEQPQ